MKKILLFILLTTSTQIFAIDLANISAAQLDGIMEDFSGNMVHSSVTGASSSAIFGFQVGVIASTIASPNLEEIDSSVDKIVNGGIFAKIDLPLGFGAEAIIAPVEVDNFKYNYKSIAGHWTTTFSILDMKIKGFITKGEIDFVDPDNGDVKYEHSGYGLNLIFGKTFLFVEPYAGIGYVSGDNKLVANGIFDVVGTQQIAAGGVDTKDTYFFAGADVSLLIMKLGLEVSNPYGNNKIAARVSFGF